MAAQHKKYCISRWLGIGFFALCFFQQVSASVDTTFDPLAAREAYENNLLVKAFRLTAGGAHACLLTPEGVRCWGSDAAGQTTVPVLVHPVEIAAGGAFTCAIDQGETGQRDVVCWGANDKGQLMAPALSNPVSITAGDAHACALDDNGVHCWGDNTYGQATVPDLVEPESVNAGGQHTCAIARQSVYNIQGVQCWGSNAAGQIALSAVDFPLAVYTGFSHTCVWRQGVEPFTCWGDNSDGRADTPERRWIMMASAGRENTCTVDLYFDENNSGHYRVLCWGSNADQQLVIPALISPPVVAAGNGFVCALDLDGVKCWGRNDQGQATPPAMVWDPDGDGLLYAQEVAKHTDPLRKDTDGDNFNDDVDPLPENASALNALAGKSAGDGIGMSLAFVGDFNQDGFGDYAIGSPAANKGAGKVEIISGSSGSVLFSMSGNIPKAALGFAVTGNADINKDGIADAVVSAPLASGENGEKAVGKVTVIYGCTGVNCTTTEDIYGTEVKAMFGAALALGDFDNDGHADVVVGSPKAINTSAEKPLKQAGRVQVFSGADLHGDTLLDVYGATAKALAGTAVATGDFDGQAGAEVIVGAPDDDTDHKLIDAGSVKIYTHNNPLPIYTQYGDATKDYFGKALAAGADVNKDGVSDVLVGVPGLDDPANKKLKGVGGVVVLFGSSSGSYQRSESLLGSEPKSGLGSSVALGDVSGDGHADLIVGAPDWDMGRRGSLSRNAGEFFVYFGDDLAGYPASFWGGKANDRWGAVIAVGDVNADGYADPIVGRPGFDAYSAQGSKAVKNAGNAVVMSGRWLGCCWE
jgi:hypothetical protein